VRTATATHGTEEETETGEGQAVGLRVYRLDLHVHTVLSPCTDIADMTPRAIVRTALERNLNMIGICDHNSARNAAATTRAAAGTALTVIPGIEVTSAEEVHIVGLFPSDGAAAAMQEEIYSRLPGQNQEEVFGYQVVVDEFDQVDDLDQRLLIGATTLSTERVVELIHKLGGLAIASHVDRTGFGLFSQLGFIPPGLLLDALEVSRRSDFQTVRRTFPQARDYTLITSSDAHALDDVGAVVTRARMTEPSFDELKKALAREEGRCILEEETE
jgi:3',5'-nucleoside bisphosphate phosphatase